jgi:hypothetical protein
MAGGQHVITANYPGDSQTAAAVSAVLVETILVMANPISTTPTQHRALSRHQNVNPQCPEDEWSDEVSIAVY